MPESKYGKHIITELKAPQFSAEFNAKYAEFATRILWIDNNVVEGAAQMNCSWYCKPNHEHLAQAHSHDCDEIIGFFGSNPDDPYDLAAEIEFWLEDEKHIITASCLIFIPRGMKHCPLLIKRVDRPIFHLSTLTKGTYEWKTS